MVILLKNNIKKPKEIIKELNENNLEDIVFI